MSPLNPFSNPPTFSYIICIFVGVALTIPQVPRHSKMTSFTEIAPYYPEINRLLNCAPAVYQSRIPWYLPLKHLLPSCGINGINYIFWKIKGTVDFGITMIYNKTLEWIRTIIIKLRRPILFQLSYKCLLFFYLIEPWTLFIGKE